MDNPTATGPFSRSKNREKNIEKKSPCIIIRRKKSYGNENFHASGPLEA